MKTDDVHGEHGLRRAALSVVGDPESGKLNCNTCVSCYGNYDGQQCKILDTDWGRVAIGEWIQTWCANGTVSKCPEYTYPCPKWEESSFSISQRLYSVGKTLEKLRALHDE